MTQPVFRFAPSPNGRLHLGHAFSALMNEHLARKFGGRLLLRIEDIDFSRCRPEFEVGIYEDLAWLGLEWALPVRRQSEHFADYRAALDRLRAMDLVYPCVCSRKDIAVAVARREGKTGVPWPRDPDSAPLYPGTCRRGASPGDGEPAWRIDMAAAQNSVATRLGYARFAEDGSEERVDARPERWGDFVVARKETPTSYHLSVVVDDAFQGVTHVVRGQDLEAATDAHVLLQNLLGLPIPRYHHHPLIRDAKGDKLSKSLLAQSLAELREAGKTPAAIRAMLGFAPQG